MASRRYAALLLAGLVALGAVSRAQQPPMPDALVEMVAAERAFAARALEAGWKQAFLDYFAEEAIGFNTGTVAPARPGIAAAPDPPPDLQLVWEPRYGDIAASGDLGYLTGPAVTRRVSTPPGQGAHATYASVWKRQPDGRFLVVADVGINTPAAPAFAPGFTRAPADGRWRDGDPDRALATLREADASLTAEAVSAGAAAWAARLTPGGRLHTPDRLPFVGATEVPQGAADPAWEHGETLGAEAAASGDLGWAWGTWTSQDARGHYLRVWVRDAEGTWWLALEVRQPAPAEVL